MLNLHAIAFPQNRENTRVKIANKKNPGRDNQVRWCLARGQHVLSPGCSLDGFLITKAWTMFLPLFFIATARLSAVTFSLGYVHCYLTFYSVFLTLLILSCTVLPNTPRKSPDQNPQWFPPYIYGF